MSVIDSIGRTPVVEIEKLNPNGKVRLLAKLEGANPGGSVKDRIALRMVRGAEHSGALRPGGSILEATSGNTGIGLAMVGAALGYRVVLTMPGCVSVERRKVLEALGAELHLSPSEEGTDGAIRLAHKMLADDPARYFMPNQFDNCDNYMAHYETTGVEVLEQTDGKITHFVGGMGTTGTLMGVSRRLKEHNPEIRIVGIEPRLGHRVQGLKNMNESIVPKIFEPERLDLRWIVQDEDAFATTRRLALEEGLFVGMSSGAAMAGALRLAGELEEGIVVVVLPDRGDRYLSTSLFTSVCADCPP